jgi:hypothetical protein
MTARPRSRPTRALRGPAASWAARCALALATLILVLQLFAAAAHHDHELAAKSQHCVACVLHAHPDAAPPDAPPLPLPSAWTLLGVLDPVAGNASQLPPAGRVLPPPRAPPSFPSPR